MRSLLLALAGFAQLGLSADADWFHSSDAAFWATINKVGANTQATVEVPLKGCLKEGSTVTIKGIGACGVQKGQVVLVGGEKIGKQVIKATCGDVDDDPSDEDRVLMASYSEKCGKGKKASQQCAGGSEPVKCNKKAVCKNFKRSCGKAASCSVNHCGGCGAELFNQKKKPVCTNLCPDLSKPMKCTGNPCDYVDIGQCPDAAFCLQDSCGGCHAKLYDNYGREVCQGDSTAQCQSIGAYLGKGPAQGAAVQGDECKVVKNKGDVDLALFDSVKACDSKCQCQDNHLVDFGDCGENLGWTIINGECTQVTGCPENKLKLSFSNKKAKCIAACGDVTPPVRMAGAGAAGAAVARAPVVDRCPEDAPFTQCAINPCYELTNEPPQCAESDNKKLTCVPDYCGGCNVKWFHDGRPFECPEPVECKPGSKGCCPNGIKQKKCPACDAEHCWGANSCEVDPCNECAVSYFDAQGNEIPQFITDQFGNSVSTYFCRGPGPRLQVCGEDDEDCCDSGFKPQQCNIDQGIIDEFCEGIVCGANGNAPIGKCVANECDACSLQVLRPNGKPFKEGECETEVPDLCTQVQCPDMGEPDCGPKPTECGDWNLKCIVDKCACIWRWYSVDLRPPELACQAALQVCVPPDECPEEFGCDPLDDALTEGVPEALLNQLVCKQETCSCAPVLRPPWGGPRPPCDPSDPSCCPDGLQKHNCDLGDAEWTCGHVQCEGAEATNCYADPCNQCSAVVLDTNQQPIPHGQCAVRFDIEIATMCKKVTCPKDEQAKCPPRPKCYPKDWKLECIVDPCSCRAIWIDQDTRKMPECQDEIQPQCVPQDECPKSFDCQDIDDSVRAYLPPEILETLVCIQEECSCRPIPTSLTMLPPGFPLPCNDDDQNMRQCCPSGENPVVCPDMTQTCETVVCDGVQVATCEADPCDGCNIKLTGKRGQTIPHTKCRIPIGDNVCTGVTCPKATGPPQCGPRPAACPADWNLRCIRDACSCDRSIWVDEDVRIAPDECTNALLPDCVPPEKCPTQFACEEGSLPPGVECVQEPCTCRPIPHPGQLVQMMMQQQQQQQQMMGMQGGMGMPMGGGMQGGPMGGGMQGGPMGMIGGNGPMDAGTGMMQGMGPGAGPRGGQGQGRYQGQGLQSRPQNRPQGQQG